MLKARYGDERGFSLIELMVGIAVGLFVVLAATAIYLNATTAGRDSVHANRLNQDVRAIMDIMVADLRRSGYWSGASVGEGKVNPFTSRTGTTTTDIFVSDDCVLYAYDRNNNGSADDEEFFGFRKSGSAIQIPDQSSLSVAAGTSLKTTSLANCSTDATVTWVPVNDANEVVVTTLTFSLAGSQCMAFNEQTYSSSTANTFRQWTSSEVLVPACETVASGGTGSLTLGGANERRVEMRQLTITLTASHARDPSLTRTLTETVLIPNNRVL